MYIYIYYGLYIDVYVHNIHSLQLAYWKVTGIPYFGPLGIMGRHLSGFSATSPVSGMRSVCAGHWPSCWSWFVAVLPGVQSEALDWFECGKPKNEPKNSEFIEVHRGSKGTMTGNPRIWPSQSKPLFFPVNVPLKPIPFKNLLVNVLWDISKAPMVLPFWAPTQEDGNPVMNDLMALS